MERIDGIAIPLPMEQIADFCRRWKITEFALFGSVLRDDFGPESDVDVLVEFAPDAGWSLFDHVAMQNELCRLFRRRVDLLTRFGVEHSLNKPLRKNVLNSLRVIHVE